jgi:hypothetical protein
MPKPTKYSDHLTDWAALIQALEQNEASLPYLTLPREKLENYLEQAREVFNEQAVHSAAKQDSSRRLETLVELGGKLATFLKTGVREHYGNRSEKLAEFRIQPFRGRPRGATPPPPPVEATAPDSADPTTTT